MAAQEAASQSGRSMHRKLSKHLAQHPQAWQGNSRRPGQATSWDNQDAMSESTRGPHGGGSRAVSPPPLPHHVVQEPTAMYNRTQLFRQKVAQRSVLLECAIPQSGHKRVCV